MQWNWQKVRSMVILGEIGPQWNKQKLAKQFQHIFYRIEMEMCCFLQLLMKPDKQSKENNECKIIWMHINRDALGFCSIWEENIVLLLFCHYTFKWIKKPYLEEGFGEKWRKVPAETLAKKTSTCWDIGKKNKCLLRHWQKRESTC